MGNYRNTVASLPRLVGRLPSESTVLQLEAAHETCMLGEKEGIVGATVSYRGESRMFSSTELAAMFLNKLKMITHAETKAPVSDVVISVPSYFTEKERRALLDAAEIAGLNCLRTVNDVTAAAVNYGMMKTEIPADALRTVIILDIGYGGLKACLATFIKGQIEIKAHVSDMHLGGRDFDEKLVGYFAEHFLKQRKVDIRENKKALLRLRVACERIKKVLSGIQLTRMELEALVDGNDFPLEMSRQMFEELCAPLFERVGASLMELLQKAGLSPEQVDAVEIIGGSTRIPAVKAKIAQLFGKEASTTLNADESVSRGCALICAMDSPLVRVREHKIVETINFSSRLTLFDANNVLLGDFVLPRESPLGQTNNLQVVLPLETLLPIVVEAKYIDDSDISPEIPRQFAKFQLALPAGGQLPSQTCALDLFVRFNASGLVEMEKATITEQQPSTAASAQGSSANTESEGTSESDKPTFSTCPPPPQQQQQQPVPKLLTIKSETFRLPRQTVVKMKDAEIAMSLHDKLVSEIDDRRNAVEEYIYEARAKLDDAYASVCSEGEKSELLNALSRAEDWLYNEGADLGKEPYIQKLDELRALMKPLSARLVEQAKATATATATGTTSPRAEEPEASKDAADTSSSAGTPHMDMD